MHSPAVSRIRVSGILKKKIPTKATLCMTSFTTDKSKTDKSINQCFNFTSVHTKVLDTKTKKQTNHFVCRLAKQFSLGSHSESRGYVYVVM